MQPREPVSLFQYPNVLTIAFSRRYPFVMRRKFDLQYAGLRDGPIKNQWSVVD